MNAAGVCKGVGAHNGLVGLHGKAGNLTDQAACCHDLLGIDAHFQIKVVFAGFERHDGFFQRAIARTLAQAVDGAFDLARATDLDAGQRVGYGHTQVVVAVHAPDGLVAVGNTLTQGFDESAVQLRYGVANRIGNIDGGGAFFDDCFNNLAEKIHFTAISIFGAEFHIGAQAACLAYGHLGLFQHLLGRHAQFFLHMQGAGGDKGVDAATGSVFQCFASAGDIAFIGTRQRADRCILDGVGNGLHALEITVGAGRKACFDHVHAQALQLAGNADFFIARHAGAGRLFAVTQGGIENNDFVAHGDVLLGSSGFAVATC